MKRLLFCISLILCPACWSLLSAGEEYNEDMDSLLHKVEGHRQGIVLVDNEGFKLKIYVSCYFTASNGIKYYRWWEGNLLYGIHDWDYLSNAATVSPLSYGYRHDGERMYVYNFLTEQEQVAYDFALQPGEQFTTPDGVCWEVVGRRSELFESIFDRNLTSGRTDIDFRNELVVLSLQSLDGTLTDEWVQYIGSMHYPIQTWGRTDIECARTAFYNFGDQDDKLVYFNFAEDPLYGQYVDVDPDPYAHTELTRNYSIDAGEVSLDIAINYYTWFTRHYCYTYRIGNTFDIHSCELGPYLDGGDATPSFGLTFPGAPSFDSYNIIYNGTMLPASIDTPQDTSTPPPAFDLSGRRLAVPPARGAYIEDGKVKLKY